MNFLNLMMKNLLILLISLYFLKITIIIYFICLELFFFYDSLLYEDELPELPEDEDPDEDELSDELPLLDDEDADLILSLRGF